MRPKVLISCLACRPGGSSEAFFGWEAVSALRERYDLDIVTDINSKKDFDLEESRRGLGFRVHFVGKKRAFHANRMVARLQSWFSTMSQARELCIKAAQLHQQRPFDLFHHVTVSSWRVPCPLWRLGAPLVWGPVGGGEPFPWKCRSALSISAQGFEGLREASNWISKRSGEVKSTARLAAACVAANQDTFNFLVQLRGSNLGVHLLSPAIFSQEKINFFQQGREGKADKRELKIFSGGILDGRKGVSIALMALARARQKGVKFFYRVAGGGPERAHLQRVARNLGIQDRVIFQESLAHSEYQKELAQTHLFLLPSLREHTGLSLLEAMLSGCVPIVADCGGPGHFVGPDRGFKIPLMEPNAMAELLCGLLEKIYRQEEILAPLGSQASRYVAENFTTASYLEGISGIYKEAKSASRACG